MTSFKSTVDIRLNWIKQNEAGKQWLDAADRARKLVGLIERVIQANRGAVLTAQKYKTDDSALAALIPGLLKRAAANEQRHKRELAKRRCPRGPGSKLFGKLAKRYFANANAKADERVVRFGLNGGKTRTYHPHLGVLRHRERAPAGRRLRAAQIHGHGQEGLLLHLPELPPGQVRSGSQVGPLAGPQPLPLHRGALQQDAVGGLTPYRHSRPLRPRPVRRHLRRPLRAYDGRVRERQRVRRVRGRGTPGLRSGPKPHRCGRWFLVRQTLNLSARDPTVREPSSAQDRKGAGAHRRG